MDILSDTDDLENQAAELAYKLRNEERHKWAIAHLEKVVPTEKHPIWDYKHNWNPDSVEASYNKLNLKYLKEYRDNKR